jgi:Exo70 exocyst complex subunit
MTGVSCAHAERPKAEDVFYSGKAREVKTLTTIMALMVQIGEQGCLQKYVASRQQIVNAMMQVVATSVSASVPTGAHTERKIHECVLHCLYFHVCGPAAAPAMWCKGDQMPALPSMLTAWQFELELQAELPRNHSSAELRRWANQMRMLAQVLEWEDRLARNMVPSSTLPATLHRILSGVVDRTVAAGATLATGRVKVEQIFPLLDMIATMHDPYVLPSMKKAFRARTMAELKDKFLALLEQLCAACHSCVQAFSASVAADVGQTSKDAMSLTTVAAQTAFAMRVLAVRMRGIVPACGSVPCAVTLQCSVMFQCSTQQPRCFCI